MMRGLIGGLFWGIVLSAVAVVLVARIMEPRSVTGPEPSAGAVEVPPGSEFNAERPDTEPVLPGTDDRPETVVTRPAAPTVDGGSTPAAAGTEAPGTPETGAPASETIAAPETGTAPELNAPDTGDTASLPATSSPRPATPGAEAPPAAVAPLETPETGVPETAAIEAPSAGPAPALDGGGEEIVLPAPGTVPPSQPGAETDPTPETASAPPVRTPDPEPSGTEGGEATETDPGGPTPDTAPETAESPEAPELPVVRALPGTAAGIRLDTPEITAPTPGVTTDRLPRIGARDDAGDEAGELTEATPAIAAFATPFEPADTNAPFLSVVLLDGPGAPAADTLAGFPVPLTVALDPLAEGAAARMAELRAAGVEIAMLAPLPEGAAPEDVEVAFQTYFATLPEAVAVMDLPGAPLQENRPRAAQVVAILGETGHGLLTYDRGLNAILQIADGADVPAATVFRAFDDGVRDKAAMKRFLDQGAFRAGQEGAVVLTGDLRAETLAALTEWVLGQRASTIAVAPLSATLQAR